MTSIKTKLGGETYASKTAAKAAIRRLLHSSPVGVRLDSEVHAILRDLLSMHPGADRKRGPGLVGFEVRIDENYRSRCFVALRVDGTVAPFSYKVCFEPWLAGAKPTVRAALRREVQEQIDAFRRTALRAGPPVDAITGASIPADKVRVDHAPPTFETLVRTWQEENFLTDENLATFEPRLGSGEVLLLDRDLAADWRGYHGRRAVLRLVSEETNQALQRRAA